MYIVICPNNVVIRPTLKSINKKLSSSMKEEDFKSFGRYRIIQLDKSSLEFVKDIKIMESIPMKILYKKDMLIPILIGFNILLNIIWLVKG